MAAYLEREVLQEQSTPLQDFLVSTSLVDTMTGELCDALLGRDGSQAVLEKLERRQLFVTAQDSHGLAFRYHPLFLGFLRSRLAADRRASGRCMNAPAAGMPGSCASLKRWPMHSGPARWSGAPSWSSAPRCAGSSRATLPRSCTGASGCRASSCWRGQRSVWPIPPA
jgi:LuxR family maltose regulon positive regulatory protein